MWVRRIGSVAALAALVVTPTSSQASPTASKKIPLPPENSVQVSQLTIKATAPKGKRLGAIKVSVKNQKALGSAQSDTQVVAAISPKSSAKRSASFRIWIFIHRFQPVSQPRVLGPVPTYADVIAFIRDVDTVRVVGFARTQTCDQLSHEKGPTYGDQKPHIYDFQQDTFGDNIVLENLIFAFDTPAEEQLDNAVHQMCTGAEDPANDPPPV